MLFVSVTSVNRSHWSCVEAEDHYQVCSRNLGGVLHKSYRVLKQSIIMGLVSKWCSLGASWLETDVIYFYSLYVLSRYKKKYLETCFRCSPIIGFGALQSSGVAVKVVECSLEYSVVCPQHSNVFEASLC